MLPGVRHPKFALMQQQGYGFSATLFSQPDVVQTAGASAAEAVGCEGGLVAARWSKSTLIPGCGIRSGFPYLFSILYFSLLLFILQKFIVEDLNPKCLSFFPQLL